MKNTFNDFEPLTKETLKTVTGGAVNPTCGVLVAASLYIGLTVAGGPVGLLGAIATGAVAAGGACR